MAFKKGQAKIGGKKKGSLNKLTKSVKEVFTAVFDELQSVPCAKLSDWAKENPSDFYKLSAKLIPTSVNAEISFKKIGLDLEEDIYE